MVVAWGLSHEVWMVRAYLSANIVALQRILPEKGTALTNGGSDLVVRDTLPGYKGLHPPSEHPHRQYIPASKASQTVLSPTRRCWRRIALLDTHQRDCCTQLDCEIAGSAHCIHVRVVLPDRILSNDLQKDRNNAIADPSCVQLSQSLEPCLKSGTGPIS